MISTRTQPPQTGAEDLGFLPALLALAPMVAGMAKKKKAVATPKPPPVVVAAPAKPLWPWLAGGGAVLVLAGVGAWLVLRKRKKS